MISRHQLSSGSRQKLVIALLALGILVLALVSVIPTRPSAKASTEETKSGRVVRRSQEPKVNCCGGDEGDNKPHILAGSYYSLKNDFSAKLLLNNKGPSPIEVRPTIFAMSGEEFRPPAVTIAGNTHEFINLVDWVAAAGPQFREGSIQLFHRGKDLVIGSQIYLTDGSGRLSFDEKLGEPGNSSSSALAGVWWLPSPKGPSIW